MYNAVFVSEEFVDSGSKQAGMERTTMGDQGLTSGYKCQ